MRQAILDHLAALGPQTIGELAHDLSAEVYEIRSCLRVLYQRGEVECVNDEWRARG